MMYVVVFLFALLNITSARKLNVIDGSSSSLAGGDFQTFLAQLQSAVNEECTKTSPSTYTIQLYAKELIQYTVIDVLESGVLLDQTKVQYSIFSPIIEELARKFASQNFKDCKSKMVNYQDLSLLSLQFMEWMKENQDEEDVLLYDEDVVFPLVWTALEDNPACFDPVHYGLLASAPNCTRNHERPQGGERGGTYTPLEF